MGDFMKKKLLSSIQSVIFLAFVGACVLDYHAAMQKNKAPHLSGAQNIEMIKKSPIWLGLIHSNLLASFWVEKEEAFKKSKPILNTENVDISILPFSSYMQIENTVLPFATESSEDEKEASFKKKQLESALENKDINAFQKALEEDFDASLFKYPLFDSLETLAEEEENLPFVKEALNRIKKSPVQIEETSLCHAFFNEALSNYDFSRRSISTDSQQKKEFALLILDYIDFENDKKAKLNLLSEYAIFEYKDIFEKAVEKGAVYNFSNSQYHIFNMLPDLSNPTYQKLIRTDKKGFFVTSFKERLGYFIHQNNQEMLSFLKETYPLVSNEIDVIIQTLNSSSKEEALLFLKKMDDHVTLNLKQQLPKDVFNEEPEINLVQDIFKSALIEKKAPLLDAIIEFKKGDKAFLTQALKLSFEENNMNTTKALLNAGADKNILSPLELIELEKALNPTQYQLNLDFLKAVQENNFNLAKDLLEKGANVNTQTKESHPPLLYAIEHKNKEMVELLLNKGADVKAKNKKGIAALNMAAYRGNVEIFKALYEAIQELERKIKEEEIKQGIYRTSHIAYSCGMRDYLPDPFIKEIKPLLLHFEMDINNPDGNYSPLAIATYAGYQEIFDFLISQKIDIDTPVGFELETPLIIAAQKGNYKMVEALLNAGAKIDKSICANDDDALKYAISNGHMDIAKLLIEKGAPMETKKLSSSISTLSYAVIQNNLEMVNLLLEKGTLPDACSSLNFPALTHAVIQNNEVLVKTLLEKKANPNLNNPLYFAVQNKNEALIRLLVQYGADVNARVTDISNRIISPSSDNIYKKLDQHTDDQKIKDLLYELGLNPKISPLEEVFDAIRLNNETQVKKAVSQEVDLNEKNKEGDTPLLYTFKKNIYHCAEIAKILIENGADPTLLDKEGKSILDYWEYTDDRDLFEQIVQKKPKLNKENASSYINVSLRLHSTSLLELMLEQGIELPKKYVEYYDEKSFLKTACLSSQKVCAFLLNNGFDVNEKEENEDHFILDLINYKINTFENPIDHLRFLVEKGVHLKAVDNYDKKGVLHKLKYLQMKDVLRFLVQNGVDVNMKDKAGYTPLMDTVSQNDITKIKLDYIKELIALGADVNAKNNDGQTALDVFKNQGFIKDETYQEIVDLFKPNCL